MRAGWAAMLMFAGLSGCVTGKELGKNVTEGAISGVKAQQAKPGKSPLDPEKIAHKATQGAIRGALDVPLTPQEENNLRTLIDATVGQTMRSVAGGGVEQPGGGLSAGEGITGQPSIPSMDRLGAQLAAGLTRALSAQLARELGGAGQGPLGQSLAATAHGVAAASVAGAREGLPELFAGCQGPDRSACIDARVRALTAATSAGAFDGLAHILQPLLLAVAFLAGLLFAGLMFLLGRAGRARTEKRPPSPAHP